MSDQSSPPSGLPPWMQMFELTRGYWVTQAIYVVARLGIADLVEKSPQTAVELANATDTHAPSLRRLMLMLSSMGIFVQDTSGRFGQTPLSETLRSDHQMSLRDITIFMGSNFMWKSWGDLYNTIASGKPAFDRMFGTSFFEHLNTHPGDSAIFNAAMRGLSLLDPAIPHAYDFGQFKRLVDIGGGTGALLHVILSANSNLKGVLYNLPSVVANATILRIGEVVSRCEIIGGDFFQSVPEGADAYLARQIIHDWNDEDALKILRNCRQAIRPKGKLLLIESVLLPPNQPDQSRALDVNMMVVSRGIERDESEFRALLGEAGFALTRIYPTMGPTSIIESQAA